ncbi:hypothetical protein D3C87_1445230 [compost metagenome]
MKIWQRVLFITVPDHPTFADVGGDWAVAEKQVLQSSPSLPMQFFVFVVTVGASQLVNQEHVDVVLQVFAHAGQVVNQWNTNRSQMFSRADTRA